MRRTAAIAALTLTTMLGITTPAAASESFYIYVFSKDTFAAAKVCWYVYDGYATQVHITVSWPSGKQVSSALCTVD